MIRVVIEWNPETSAVCHMEGPQDAPLVNLILDQAKQVVLRSLRASAPRVAVPNPDLARQLLTPAGRG